jgi:hypothetical protein
VLLRLRNFSPCSEFGSLQCVLADAGPVCDEEDLSVHADEAEEVCLDMMRGQRGRYADDDQSAQGEGGR